MLIVKIMEILIYSLIKSWYYYIDGVRKGTIMPGLEYSLYGVTKNDFNKLKAGFKHRKEINYLSSFYHF